jgi:hypothetical protein
MSIMELGALGEFVGSIAVLLTLAYVAVQVRHSRSLLEESRKISLSQVNQARMDSRQAIHIAGMDEGMATILAKLRFWSQESPEEMDFDQLDDVEKQRLSHYIQLNLLLADNNYYQQSLGLLSHDDLVTKSNRERSSKIWQQSADMLGLVVPPRLLKCWKAEGFL